MSNKYDDDMKRLEAGFLLQSPGRSKKRGTCQRYDSALPLTEHDLSQLEAILPDPIPDGYRHFLQFYGDACWRSRQWDCRLIDEPDITLNVSYFFGIRENSCYPLRPVYETNVAEFDLPPRLLPIAQCDGGLYCISLSGDDRGQVLGWHTEDVDREEVDGELIAISEGASVVAYAFDEFLHQIYLID
ncbi:SMI1 / KNR4 family protein [Symmachiella macrocystis]|uniref:SMI1 / KNR4 family protein n=1 Tax=Symmachiella macrocystis TaxID=2527985 RepID=A0A5C6BMN1_9PLAN|nr:SMI1/KNR4 family protein [Symmachiella macrocystis]TWU12992.1 SMI1 / KNR4 family protein [Symmachiella macrocystis]